MTVRRYQESEARNLSEDEFNDILYQSMQEEAKGSKSVVEFNAKDPSSLDHEGVYLEVVILSDGAYVIRDRWLTYDADYEITGHPYAAFLELLNHVDAQEAEDDQEADAAEAVLEQIRKA